MSIFTAVQNTRVGYNTFNLSHVKKLTADWGELFPTLLLECVPGDRFTLSQSQLVRLAPMIAPVMHQVTMYTHYFFVPNRLLWDEWEAFITGGRLGENEVVFPTVELEWTYVDGVLNTDFPRQRKLWDYFGLYAPPAPTGTGTEAVTMTVNFLPFSAYSLIWNEYYRDQNISSERLYKAESGSTQTFLPILLNRAWQHDYFTSGLPFTQRGPEATIPLGTEAPILFSPQGVASQAKNATTGGVYGNQTGFGTNSGGSVTVSPNGGTFALDISASHVADLSAATAATIIELRRAFKLQEFLEKNARGGSRYTEIIMSHFGVRSSDARLQRPEFIGGTSVPIQFSEVLQTSSSDETSPQGNMSGHGIATGMSRRHSYRCEEHGWIIGISSIMPKTGYFQGLHRMWKKFDRFDYYWPSFAHIGEQAIYNYELYNQDETTANEENETVFAYTPRYAEYKYIPNSAHGEFRTSLDFWHLDRKFDALPTLNEDFMYCNISGEEDLDRIFAVLDEEHFWIQLYNDVKATRPMPYFGNPKM